MNIQEEKISYYKTVVINNFNNKKLIKDFFSINIFMLGILKDSDRRVFEMYYGLNGYRSFSLSEIAALLSVSNSVIQKRILRAREKLSSPIACRFIGIFTDEEALNVTDYKDYTVEKLTELLKKSTNYKYNINLNTSIDDLCLSVRATTCLKRAGFKTLKDVISNQSSLPYIRNLGKRTLQEIIDKLNSYDVNLDVNKEKIEVVNENNGNKNKISDSKLFSIDDVKIEDIGLSVRAIHCLLRYNIHTIGDVSKLSLEELLSIRSLGKVAADEIISKLESLNITLKPHNNFIKEGTLVKNIPLEKLQLSNRAYKALSRKGYNTVGDIYRLTQKDFLMIDNFGDSCLNEIITKLKELGLHKIPLKSDKNINKIPEEYRGLYAIGAGVKSTEKMQKQSIYNSLINRRILENSNLRTNSIYQTKNFSSKIKSNLNNDVTDNDFEKDIANLLNKNIINVLYLYPDNEYVIKNKDKILDKINNDHSISNFLKHKLTEYISISKEDTLVR